MEGHGSLHATITNDLVFMTLIDLAELFRVNGFNSWPQFAVDGFSSWAVVLQRRLVRPKLASHKGTDRHATAKPRHKTVASAIDAISSRRGIGLSSVLGFDVDKIF